MTNAQQEKAVTWLQISNIVPLAFTLLMGIIGITGFFYAIRGSVEIINVKLEQIILNQENTNELLDRTNAIIDDHEKRIQFLENTR